MNGVDCRRKEREVEASAGQWHPAQAPAPQSSARRPRKVHIFVQIELKIGASHEMRLHTFAHPKDMRCPRPPL